jgi:hypothetical protein
MTKYSTDEREGPDPKPVNSVVPSTLTPGQVCVGEVDRLSNSGNAMVEGLGGYRTLSEINLGQLDSKAVGERVRFKYINNGWGKCLVDEYTSKDYSPGDSQPNSSDGEKSNTGTNRHGPQDGESKSDYTSSGTKPSSTSGTITSKNPSNKNKLLKGNQ